MTDTEKQLVHLVDDDEAIRHSASFMLRLAGYRVQTHPDGVSFLDKLDELETGCVLLDVQMPKMNGLAVQKALNERGCEMIYVRHEHCAVAAAMVVIVRASRAPREPEPSNAATFPGTSASSKEGGTCSSSQLPQKPPQPSGPQGWSQVGVQDSGQGSAGSH